MKRIPLPQIVAALLFSQVAACLQPQAVAQSNPLRISLYVAVDKSGAYLKDLAKKDFVITENKVEQATESFQFPGDEPASIFVLIDRGKKTTVDDLERAQSFVMALARAIRLKHELALAAFSTDIQIIQPFSADFDQIEQASKRIPAFAGQSITGDAVDYSIRRIRDSARYSRRVLVVLSPGFEKFGPATVDHVMEHFLQLHTVNIGGESFGRLFIFGESTSKNLRNFSETTGGKFWDATSPEKARESGEQLGAFLEAQYTLTYTPSNPSRKGKLREVTVRVSRPGTDLNYLQRYFEPRF